MGLPVRILVIDDDADIRDILTSELRLANCDVVECESHASALRCLTEQKFELIVSDLSLGDGNGLQLLRHLRNDLKLATPFILMSGDLPAGESESKYKEADALIPKPFDLERLVLQLVGLAKEAAASMPLKAS